MSRSLLHGGVDHGAPLSPEEYNTLLGLKIGCIGLIPALSFCGALAPLFSKQIRQNTTAISYCNVLAGSILLGFGFLHILPDAAESFSEWDESVNHFPIVYAMVMVGFFVVLLIEKLLILRIEKLAAERRRAKEMKKIELAAPDVAEKIEDEECGNCGDCKDVSDKSGSSRISQRDLLQRKETEEVVVDLSASKSNHDHHGYDHHHDHDHDHAHAFHTHDVPMDNESKSATPYVLTIGLAFHSIFEGLALAFAGSIDAMVLLIIGIGLHKFAEGFAMGSSLVKMDLRLRRCLLLVAAFCIVLPIGIAIGLGLGEALDEDALNLTMSLTNSFAVGVFIYIAILGVYVEELAGKNHVFAKIGLALVMCLTMGCLSLLEA